MASTGSPTTPLKQLAMVFDLNKCLGCQTCSVACKVLWTQDEGEDYQWWCTVNTLPGQGHPRGWEEMGGGYRDGHPLPGRLPTRAEFGGGWQYNYEQVYSSAEHIPLRPVDANGTTEWGPNWDEDEGGGEYPNSYFFYMPRLCNHCTRPLCLEACPRGAMYKRPQDGIVLRDEDECRGYRFCLEACPYKKIYFNFAREVSQHCILCYPRLEKGVAPACVRQCPGRLVYIGMLDDEEGPIHKLVHQWRVALPLHPEYGTEPNIFYIPPLAPYRLNANGSLDESTPRIPPYELERLFGPQVNQALKTLKVEMERKRDGKPSELMDTLIVYHWNELLGPYTKDPATIRWR
jgi:ethylbenzene hydroxylase subunit beta/complex iron-sulfur molybdoenzyme family reductase subunit beta